MSTFSDRFNERKNSAKKGPAQTAPKSSFSDRFEARKSASSYGRMKAQSEAEKSAKQKLTKALAESTSTSVLDVDLSPAGMKILGAQKQALAEVSKDKLSTISERQSALAQKTEDIIVENWKKSEQGQAYLKYSDVINRNLNKKSNAPLLKQSNTPSAPSAITPAQTAPRAIQFTEDIMEIRRKQKEEEDAALQEALNSPEALAKRETLERQQKKDSSYMSSLDGKSVMEHVPKTEFEFNQLKEQSRTQSNIAESAPEELRQALENAQNTVAEYTLRSKNGLSVEEQAEYMQAISDVDYLQELYAPFAEKATVLPSPLASKYDKYTGVSAEKTARTLMDRARRGEITFESEIANAILHPKALPEDGGEYLEYVFLMDKPEYNAAKMTNVERYAYFSILQNQGAAAADAFYEELEPYLKERRSAEYSEITQEIFAEGPWWKKALVSAGEVATVALSPFELAGRSITDEEFGLSNFTGAIEDSTNAIAKDIAEDNEAYADAYQLILAGLKSAYAIFGTPAPLVFMGSDAAVSAVRDAKRRGVSHGQALLYGALIGGIEAATELIGIDALFGKPKVSLTYVLKNMAAEATEEALAEVLGNAADVMVNMDESAFYQNVQRYLQKGLSKEDAIKNAMLDVALDTTKAAAGGAILGGAFAGVNTAVDFKGNMQRGSVQNTFDTAYGEAILNGQNASEDINTLVDNALAGQNKKLAKAARAVDKSKVENAEGGVAYNASAKNVGKLARLSGQSLASEAGAIPEASKQAYITALMSSGMSKSKAKKAYETLAIDAMAGTISEESQRIIQSNDFAGAIYEKISQFVSPEAMQQRIADSKTAAPVAEVLNKPLQIRESATEKAVEYDDPVSVTSIDQYGNPVVQTASGAEITYDSASETISEPAKRKMSYAKLHGVFGANAYLKLAPERTSVEFNKTFEKLYSDGLNGREFSPVTSNLSGKIQRAIYDAGKSDLENSAARSRRAAEEAKKKEAELVKKQMGFKSDRVTVSDAAVDKIKRAKDKSVQKQYRASAAVIDALANMLQVDINITASETDANGNYISPNGSYNPDSNTFTFDILAGMNNVNEVTYTAMLKTAGHELTHFIQNWSPSKYLKLKNATLRFLAKQQGELWVEQRLDSIITANEKAGKKLTLEQARDELVADSFENVLSEIDFAETVLRTDETLFGKIHRWVKENVAKFKKNLAEALKNVGAQTEAGKILVEAGSDAAALYREWEDAFTTALENSSSVPTEKSQDLADKWMNQSRRKNENVKVDKYFSRQIEYWKDLPQGGYVKVCILSEDSPLCKVGMHKGLVVYDVSKIHKTMHDHPGHITVSILKNIPRILENPVAISEYKDKNTISVFGDVFVGHSPIVVGLVISKGQKLDTIVKIRTVHPRNDARALITDESILYLGSNKKRTLKWFRSCGIQVPLGGTKFGFIRSISQNKENVNTQLQARNLNSDLDTVTRLDLVDALDMHADTLKAADKAKLKLTLRAYRDAINAYDDARAEFQEALRSGNEELALLASATLTLHEKVIDDIERSEAVTMNLQQIKSSLGDVYSKEKSRANRAAYKEYDLKRSRITRDAREAISAMRSKLTEAKRIARDSALKAENATFRARQEAMRRKRDLHTGHLDMLRSTLKKAIDKPTETASIPKGGEQLAQNILGITGTLNELLRTRGVAKSSDEIITLIHRTAMASSFGNKSHQGTQVEPTERMIRAADALQRQLGHELAALQKEYERIQDIPTASLAYRQELATRLTEYIAENETMYAGGEEMLRHIADGITLMRAISHRLMSANRAMVAGKWVDIAELRDNLAEDVELAPKLSYKVLNKLSYALTPKTMIHLAFGATDNSDTLYAMYDDAQTRYMQYINGAKDIFKELESETAKSKINSTEAKIRTGLKDTDGNEVLLNPDLAISFVLASENEDYLRHMVWGGFQLPDLKKLYSTKSADAYVDNRFTEHLTAEQSIKDYLGERVSDEDIAAALDRIEKQRELSDDDFIIYQAKLELESNGTAASEAEMKEKYRAAARLIKSQLDPLSLRWLGALRGYYNGYAKEHLDKATMERYGFTKTLSSANVYYPIKVVKSQVGGEQNELIKRDASLESLGSMKSRKKSKIGVKLFGAVSSINDQIEEAATYYGWINAIDTIKKTLDSRIELESDDKTTVKTTLIECVSKRYGNTKLDKYLNELESAIVGKGQETNNDFERYISFLHSSFVSSALAFNLSPALKQTSALPLVAADSGYKSLVKGVAHGIFESGGAKWKPMLTNAQINHISKYSTVYKYRAGGLISIDLAALKNSSNPISKFMQKYPNATGVSWCEFVDAQTLGFQFYAIRDSVRKAHKDWDSEKVNIEAGKMLDKTIQNFQANYTILQRSPVLRGVGKLTVGVFKSQQITLLNAQLDSILRVQTLHKHIKSGNGDTSKLKAEFRQSFQYAAKVAAASAVSYIANAALAMLIATIYRRKEWDDKSLLEDAGWEILQSYMQMVPFLGDLAYSLAEKIAGRGYYTDSIGEISAVEMLWDMFLAMIDVAEKMAAGELTFDRFAKDLGKVLAPAGIPFRNAYNIVKAFLEWCGIAIE